MALKFSVLLDSGAIVAAGSGGAMVAAVDAPVTRTTNMGGAARRAARKTMAMAKQ